MLSFLNWIKRNVGRYVTYMFLSKFLHLGAEMFEFACLTG